jgi:hypothetical protein
MNNSQLINQDSGDYEWYTPPEIIAFVRRMYGVIQLDPASSEQANKTVQAVRFYSENGLDKPWYGDVWMNHPFSRKNNPLWINKAVEEYVAGRARQLTCITYASTSEGWFQPLTEFPQCYLVPRTNYYLPDGTKKRGVTKGSVVTYMGPEEELFRICFSGMGWFK